MLAMKKRTSMMLMTLPLMLLVLQTTLTTSSSLGMYKSCVYECLNCVNTWGKEVFNGERCAEDCAVTGGRSIDSTCTTYFTHSSRSVSGARQFLRPEDVTGRHKDRLAGGYTGSYQGHRSYHQLPLGVGEAMTYRSFPEGRSTLFRDCQRLCRQCDARFTSTMDAHSCLYTCARTQQAVIAC